MRIAGVHILGCCMSLLLAGCGDQQAPASVKSETNREGAAATGSTTVTLAYNRYLNLSFSEHPSPFAALQSYLEAHQPELTVSLSVLPDASRGHRDALVVWLMAEDDAVDLYGIDAPWVPEFAQAGWAVPLGELVPELARDFLPAGLEAFSWQGQPVGVPFWGSIGGLYWRKDLLQEAGIVRPTTFSDLTNAVRKVLDRHPELSGYLWPGGRNEALIQTWAEIFIGFGGRYFHADGRCAVNSPAGHRALNFMRDAPLSGISPREVVVWNAEEARQRFVSGEAVFLRHNQDLLSWLDDTNRSRVAGKWAFGPNPAGPAGRSASVTGGFAFVLNPYSRNREAAVRVLRALASEEVQRAFGLAWGPVQYHRRVYEDPGVRAVNAHLDQLAAVLPDAVARPASSDYAQLSDILQREIHAALTGQKPVAEALDQACIEIDALGKRKP
ncbi:MAG TPA: hypothetical protein DCY13_14175 [Verrucomicrobiales bacterium]|nr:hypothetical protein [Verrucomicrobiales bacterium]